MSIMFDTMATQVQVQNATGTRLNTLFDALRDAGYDVRYRNYSLPMSQQLDGVDVFVVLTHLWTQAQQPIGTEWPPVIPQSTDFAWSSDDLNAIQSWVSGGGSLFLISSHTEFTLNDIPLAAKFGIRIVPAFFCQGQPTLQDPLVMTPTDAWPALAANVSNVQAWDSCGISTVTGDVATILPFPAGTYDGSGKNYYAGYYAFAVAKTYGYGDVVVAGHSGIAGDPLSVWPSPGQIDAGDTKQFLLNCIGYLASDQQPG